MTQMPTYCGIAWSADGFAVEILDGQGSPAAPPSVIKGGDVEALAGTLAGLAGEVRAVVDSTNGAVDGTLLAAGISVFRADPPELGRRPAFGSVSARELADLARLRPDVVTPVQLEEGSLTGRSLGCAAGASVTACWNGSRDEPRIALTFDDGPHPRFTGEVLDVLSRYGIPATFFCVGIHAVSQPRVLARIADLGHCVANHTWSHPFLPDLSAAEVREQIERTREVIGDQSLLMRPPYGVRVPSLPDSGEKVILWDVEAHDWALPGTEYIAECVLAATQPGSIIVLHDGGGDRSQTVAALPAIIGGCLARGLVFGTVPEVIAA